jgi:hypothetical protein
VNGSAGLSNEGVQHRSEHVGGSDPIDLTQDHRTKVFWALVAHKPRDDCGSRFLAVYPLLGNDPLKSGIHFARNVSLKIFLSIGHRSIRRNDLTQFHYEKSLNPIIYH